MSSERCKQKKFRAAKRGSDPRLAALQATKPGDVIVTVFSQQTAIKATIIR
jgi:hypothetical protein